MVLIFIFCYNELVVVVVVVVAAAAAAAAAYGQLFLLSLIISGQLLCSFE